MLETPLLLHVREHWCIPKKMIAAAVRCQRLRLMFNA